MRLVAVVLPTIVGALVLAAVSLAAVVVRKRVERRREATVAARRAKIVEAFIIIIIIVETCLMGGFAFYELKLFALNVLFSNDRVQTRMVQGRWVMARERNRTRWKSQLGSCSTVRGAFLVTCDIYPVGCYGTAN